MGKLMMKTKKEENVLAKHEFDRLLNKFIFIIYLKCIFIYKIE